MTYQIADVTQPLGSACAMLEAGNKVVFEKGNSYIVDKTRKVKTRIEERNDAYVFDLWMPKDARSSWEDERAVHTGRYQALMENEREFTRQEDLF